MATSKLESDMLLVKLDDAIKDKLKDAFHVTHDEIANINILENFIPRGL